MYISIIIKVQIKAIISIFISGPFCWLPWCWTWFNFCCQSFCSYRKTAIYWPWITGDGYLYTTMYIYMLQPFAISWISHIKYTWEIIVWNLFILNKNDVCGTCRVPSSSNYFRVTAMFKNLPCMTCSRS